MKKLNTISIDLAKSVFQVAVFNKKGKMLSNKEIRRSQLLKFIAKQEASRIVMESCASSNYWGRRFLELGHEVKLISAQHVKPFVKTHKNDANDAIAIYEASCRPHMTFVHIKSVEEQDIQSLIRARQALVDKRVNLMNQARGILSEYGIIFAVSENRLKAGLMSVLNGDTYTPDVSSRLIELVSDWYDELINLGKAIDDKDKAIRQIAKQSETAKRLMEIEGIGPMIAVTMIATLGSQVNEFKNGRQMAAYLGLTPQQFSSGGKTKLGRISKRGDKYLRTLLVNGASSVMRWVEKKSDPKTLWVKQLMGRMHNNKARLALANKMARIAWVIMARGVTYKPELASTVY